ncbi:MAG: bi-domain-containing oxidoreductase, partial [Lachnospiraceae bacterium]|nr:bi-domain-containing oxidoreductase [Lachnospiraceae bacterium]
MKQAFVTRSGVICEDVQEPPFSRGKVLVDVKFSCISAGTEMNLVRSSKKPLVKRVLEDPKKLIPQAMTMLKNRGAKVLMKAVQNATSRKAVGYTAAGVVRESGVEGFKPGDRVAIFGVGYANHAAVDSAPVNMTARIPDNVSFEEASTAAVGCIAMQGVRRLEPVQGETIVVMGLGIMGILAVQMLKGMGCRVIGIDLNADRMRLAKKLGCDEVVHGGKGNVIKYMDMLTDGKGVDGVLFTAATHSSVPMSNCFKMLRRKGRFVLLGVSGMEIDRADIYAKELDFKIATSYGAGRYDNSYEEGGADYPAELVRWTEKRNMEEYLREIASGIIDVKDMIQAVYPIEQVNEAYLAIEKPNAPLITLLQYQKEATKTKIILKPDAHTPAKGNIIRYAVVGAGNFVRSMHMPNLDEMKDMFYLRAVMSRTGTSASSLAYIYGAEYFTTDYQEILNDPQIDMVMICTRHDLHAPMAIQALRAGKAVFVEKPAAINAEQLAELKQTCEETGVPYFVGFNRRFSDYIQEICKATADRKTPLNIIYTMNAGLLPKDHWTHGRTGGGRIVGEGCHIIDTLTAVVGKKPIEFSVDAIHDEDGYYSPHDNVSLTIRYEDGSIATMLYLAQGSPSYQKETMKVYWDGKQITLNDYSTMNANGIKIKNIRSAAPSKGHKQELIAFYRA